MVSRKNAATARFDLRFTTFFLDFLKIHRELWMACCRRTMRLVSMRLVSVLISAKCILIIGVSLLWRLAAPGMMKMELGLGSLWLEAGDGSEADDQWSLEPACQSGLDVATYPLLLPPNLGEHVEQNVSLATSSDACLRRPVRVTALRRAGDKATSSTPWSCPATVSPCQGSGRRKPGFESCSPATSVVSVAQDGISAHSLGVKSIAGEPDRLVWCRLVQGGSAMDTSNLLSKFARIGARLKVADRPSRRFRTASGVISLDVLEDREGEFFEVARRPETGSVQVQVTLARWDGIF
jgi:hypothetical protein